MSGRHAARRHAAPRRRPRLRTVLPALAGVTVLTVGGMGTYAYWTDSATVQGGALVSGSLDLTIDGQQGNPTSYTWSALATSGLAPGESRAAVMTVANAGDVPFTYHATGASGGDAGLRGTMTIRVVLGGVKVPDNDNAYPIQETCSGGTDTFDAHLDASGAVQVLPTGGGTDPRLAKSASIGVCVQVTMDSDAPDSVQGKTYQPSFTFTAAQATS
ncbi:SipW-dependent-type signal peptide-containing protein [Nocardioides acrostichi]|uniref:Uncharacterized protein n=1 Tax=Nocardioides acrostichi TaxID=2784339 RepID=A0A930YC74_9ACTN|nr:SipW-dependent-type signal peptide-containing protein [Nocardioides acrostichi]MBF4161199.1 hypothetical protein [Nocardioides acrostichi]